MRPSEQYQLAFDFAAKVESKPDITQYHQSDLDGLSRLHSRELALSRFVRAVREPVTIHSSKDAADYLMTRIFSPFRP